MVLSITTVSQRMAPEGFQRTSEQCHIKCKNPRQEYLKIKDHNSRRGVNGKSWIWFTMMDAIYGQKPVSMGREAGMNSATSLLEEIMK